jgi:hypothetical protein
MGYVAYTITVKLIVPVYIIYADTENSESDKTADDSTKFHKLYRQNKPLGTQCYSDSRQTNLLPLRRVITAEQ